MAYPADLPPARVYVEPTTACNLGCRTCMRNAWGEPTGVMTAETFALVLEGIGQFSPVPSVFFGGYGEPLTHPRILEMVRLARQRGAGVELITNGVLLTEETSRSLIASGLDRLWVSIDGARPEGYADVRLGAALPRVLANLERFGALRKAAGSGLPRLGIAFVAMRRNIADLPQVVQLGSRLGADSLSVTHLLAHTRQLCEQILYTRFYEGKETLPTACPFIERRSLAVRWDGAVSPCLPLLHTHTSYLEDRERLSAAYTVGVLHEKSLGELWGLPGYVALRERLQIFDFSPCAQCNSCGMALSNREDCFGNTHPACGGCLWAHGLIRCP